MRFGVSGRKCRLGIYGEIARHGLGADGNHHLGVIFIPMYELSIRIPEAQKTN